jgi:hypothetical protein
MTTNGAGNDAKDIHYAISPTTSQASVAVLIQEAAENCALKSGSTDAVDEIVVVPGVTASMVVVPAPI